MRGWAQLLDPDDGLLGWCSSLYWAPTVCMAHTGGLWYQSEQSYLPGCGRLREDVKFVKMGLGTLLSTQGESSPATERVSSSVENGLVP